MATFSKSVSNLRSSEIRDLMGLANKQGIILFSGGMPDNDLFPLKELDIIYHNLSNKEKQIAMQYCPTNGLPQLLDSLSTFLRKKGLPVDANRLLITTGSIQAINILVKTFVEPGDPVIVENPCFIGAMTVFKSYQADLIPVPLTPEGISMEGLKTQIERTDIKPRMIYITPNFHNPSGILYTQDNKKALIDILTNRNIPLVEDDVYSDLYFYEEDRQHLKSIKEINPEGIDVCYTGSFSKILGPGLRLGWMLVPEEIYTKCELIKQTLDACSPSYTQMLAHKFLESGMVYDYVKKVRGEYKKRAAVMVEVLKAHMPESVTFNVPRGGFYIWLQLPEGSDATDVLNKAIEKGAVGVSGKTFDPHETVNDKIRLSFCNTSEDKIRKGIPLIAEAIREVLM
ncbi:MAG: PLP-dependent aminotransferase family protein [Bacteroidales bacterium]|nr:PLP-dependent aminotransferase family protein [Bacteroidales bacterium]